LRTVEPSDVAQSGAASERTPGESGVGSGSGARR
jgi:hypothetical protein